MPQGLTGRATAGGTPVSRRPRGRLFLCLLSLLGLLGSLPPNTALPCPAACVQTGLWSRSRLLWRRHHLARDASREPPHERPGHGSVMSRAGSAARAGGSLEGPGVAGALRTSSWQQGRGLESRSPTLTATAAAHLPAQRTQVPPPRIGNTVTYSETKSARQVAHPTLPPPRSPVLPAHLKPCAEPDTFPNARVSSLPRLQTTSGLALSVRHSGRLSDQSSCLHSLDNAHAPPSGLLVYGRLDKS